ncbi:hypothetical protein DFS34DRAFT_639967 [Phlyctochytrium arcticum]|nr:hypothetical protein DFS34DRAFT_639967 [Phlyctochytrium arcticum]
MVEKCQSIEELSIGGCYKLTSTGFGKVLPFLKNVRTLNVAHNSQLDDACFRDIAKSCPLLEKLNLQRTRVTQTGVLSILELAAKLTSLDLSHCRKIGDSVMKTLLKEKPPHVTLTTYSEYDIYDNLDSNDSDFSDHFLSESDDGDFDDEDYNEDWDDDDYLLS